MDTILVPKHETNFSILQCFLQYILTYKANHNFAIKYVAKVPHDYSD